MNALFLSALLVALPRLQSGDEFKIDAPTVARTAAEVVPWVGSALGIKLEESVKVRLGTEEELAALLEAENLPLFLARFGANDAARTRARESARAIAPSLLAKYAFGRGEVLVCAGGFDRTAAALDLPRLISREGLRAVLVHELVHAADDAAHHVVDVIGKLTATEQIEAYNAVIEGHAQFVARRVCADHGELVDFDLFCRVVGGERPKPKSSSDEPDPVVEMVDRLERLHSSNWYVQGERFIEALEAEGGAAAVARAFTEPPDRMALVYEPSWFLHPELEPKGEFDLPAALGDVAAEFPTETWAHVQSSVTNAQLEAALALAPQEERERVVMSLRSSRILTLVQKDGSGSKMALVGLLEFATPFEAAAYVEVARKVSIRKDETMKSGPLQVVRSVREEFPPGPQLGYFEHKRVKLGAEEFPADGAVVADWTLVTEIVFSNDARSSAELAAFVHRVFVAAAKRRR